MPSKLSHGNDLSRIECGSRFGHGFMNAPSAHSVRSHVIEALKRYWPEGRLFIERLCVPRAAPDRGENIPPAVTLVRLPDWAADCGVDGRILVPAFTVIEGKGPRWRNTDWFYAAFWMLNGSAEREYERRHGPIHSYACKLRGWNPLLWRHAWVNRIALFLRRWAAREKMGDEQALMGPMPRHRIMLTHDVDAVSKTMAIRLKRSCFLAYNALKSCCDPNKKDFSKYIREMACYLASSDDYWCFDHITDIEKQYGVNSIFFLYAGAHSNRRTLKTKLLDPCYDVADARVRRKLRQLRDAGWKVGLHPSFEAWKDSGRIYRERRYLEKQLALPITSCRQHWLRFSWKKTWPAQIKAGIEMDYTLGFNDRPGFRTSAALIYRPLFADSDDVAEFWAAPLLLMDSQVYDYQLLEDTQRFNMIDAYIREVIQVHGEASILWHQRTLSADYNWGAGYIRVLDMLGGN